MEEANSIITELQARESSHPTVSTIWIMALTNSMRRLKNDLADARKALEAMHTESDITLEQLATIYTVFGRDR
ncbi:MAG: hypothetical protein CME61_09930 [Halobacteriovoraceae bacterium]|nr:hypothetical protein [Halobacteriovoraceae bacterium]